MSGSTGGGAKWFRRKWPSVLGYRIPSVGSSAARLIGAELPSSAINTLSIDIVGNTVRGLPDPVKFLTRAQQRRGLEPAEIEPAVQQVRHPCPGDTPHVGVPATAQDARGGRGPAPVGARDDDGRLRQNRGGGGDGSQRDVQRAGHMPVHPVVVLPGIHEYRAARLEVAEDAIRRHRVLAADRMAGGSVGGDAAGDDPAQRGETRPAGAPVPGRMGLEIGPRDGDGRGARIDG